MNWNQRKNDAQNIEIPLQMGKRKSLYEIRDKAGLEHGASDEPEERESQVPGPLSASPPVPKVTRGSNNHPVETQPTQTFPHRPLHAGPATSPSAIIPTSPAPDPFADDNFPSALHPESHPKGPSPQAHPVSPKGAEVHPSHGVHGSKTPVEPRNQTPEETVRHYVESWNDGRFAAEYRSLSKRSRVLPLEEYCQRRRSLQAAQIQSHGKSTRQEIGKFDSVAIDGEHALVEITRIDRTANGVRCYAEYFTLIVEDGEWRIKTLRQGEERRNPATPPKNRIMRADDFAGREQHLKRRQAAGTDQE